METAETYRDEAAAHRQEAHDSFERCDTDGFVSQWASGINARLADAKAKIAEDGGTARFERTILTSTDGTPIEDARVVNTRYGTKWRIDRTDEWLPFMPARTSTLAKRGYAEITEEADLEARAMTDAPPGARGLSGATSVFIRVFPPSKPKSEGWRHVGAIS